MDVETILDSFLHTLGENGTLLLPLFNFDFCGGAPFVIRTTPSHMGALTEAGRVRLGAVRPETRSTPSRSSESDVISFVESTTSADMEQTPRLASCTRKAARLRSLTFPISKA